MKKLHNLKELKARRKELRRNATLEESILWERLRNRRIGYKFRRQHSMGYYIADFYCPEKKLIIEIDGEQHSLPEDLKYDLLREQTLGDYGYRTLRIKNIDVRENVNNVIDKIIKALI
jgi:very-short-patch-repair endonuclease